MVDRSAGPVRTCIGCRRRDLRSALLRVVATEAGGVLTVVPDPHGRLPGRGASVHPVIVCLDLADRRRAYARALRLDGPHDPGPVRAWVGEQDDQRMTADEHQRLQHHPSEHQPLQQQDGTDVDERPMQS